MESSLEMSKSRNDEIILSICIPTYNASKYLRHTLNSFVSQEGFNHQCEIIISDNHSDDDTEQMILNEFTGRYGNVRYYRNPTNIEEDNLIKVMNYAVGKYIKLHGDRWCMIEHKLSDLIKYLDQADHDVVFLLNNKKYFTDPSSIQCNNFNEFVSTVSYLSTWITGLLLKNSAYKPLPNKDRYISLHFAHTDIMFRILRNASSLIITDKMLIEQIPEYKGGYNIFKVFLDNYLSLYQDYLFDGTLHYSTYRNEKIKLLTEFIFPWLTIVFILKPRRYAFIKTGALQLLFKHYKTYPQLYLYPFYLVKSIFNKFKNVIFSSGIIT